MPVNINVEISNNNHNSNYLHLNAYHINNQSVVTLYPINCNPDVLRAKLTDALSDSRIKIELNNVDISIEIINPDQGLAVIRSNVSHTAFFVYENLTESNKSPSMFKAGVATAPARAVEIKFAKEIAIVPSKDLEIIFAKLYSIGYGLDHKEQGWIRHKLVDSQQDRELIFKQQVLELVKKIQINGDDPTCAEHHALIRLVHENAGLRDFNLPEQVYKTTEILRANKLFKCASGLIALYARWSKELAQQQQRLQQGIELRLEDLDEILATRLFTTIGIFDANISYKVNSYNPNLSMTINMLKPDKSQDEGESTRVRLDLVQALKAISVNEDMEVAKCEIDFPASESKRDNTIKLTLPYHCAHRLIDRILMEIQKCSMSMDAKDLYSIRKGLNMHTLSDYIRAADHVIDMLASSEKRDLTTIEYHWLVQMSGELPINQCSQFVFAVAKKLAQKDLRQCALGLCSLYVDDPLCPQIQPFVRKLQDTSSIVPAFLPGSYSIWQAASRKFPATTAFVSQAGNRLIQKCTVM